MLAYDLMNFCKFQKPHVIERLAEEVRSIQRSQGSRLAAYHFQKNVGVYPLETLNEQYYADAVNFELALLMAHHRQPEEASRLMSMVPVQPGAGGTLCFSEHVHQSTELYKQTRAAAERGMPSILINSMPKSASSSLVNNIALLMGSPVLRLSIGVFPFYALVESWLMRFANNGMVTHEHFAADAHNIALLNKVRIERLILQVRDPRACLFSMLAMDTNMKTKPPRGHHKKAVFWLYDALAKWLDDWIAAEAQLPETKIEWVYYQHYRTDPWSVIEQIFAPYESYGPLQPELEKIKTRDMELAVGNYHKGNDTAWREAMPDRLRKQLWKRTPEAVREKLSLEP